MSEREPYKGESQRRARAALMQRLSGTIQAVRPQPTENFFSEKDYPQYCCGELVSEMGTEWRDIGEVRCMQGAFGRVRVGKMRDAIGNLAVKIVDVASKDVFCLCLNEYEVLRNLRHPNVVNVYRFLLEAKTSTCCLFTEFIPGSSLQKMLQDKHSFTGTLHTEKEVRNIARQLFSALGYLEAQGVAHRDIHPGNVLLTDAVVTLIDFQTASGLRDCKGLVGTNPYQAPEMWTGQPYDCKVDVWSAGTLLTRLLRDALRETSGGVSEECKTFLAACSVIDPQKRCSAKEAEAMAWLQ